MLDPNLKKSFCRNDSTENNLIFVFPFEHCKSLVLNYLRQNLPPECLLKNIRETNVTNLTTISIVNVSASASITDSSQTSFAQPKRKLMDFFTKLPSESNNRSSLEEEFESYICAPTEKVDSAISYWFNSNSLLKSIALEVLSVPASSAPVERVFSRAGRVLSPLRTRLSVSHLETLLLINYNFNYS